MSKKQVTIIEEDAADSQAAAMKFTRGGRSSSLMGSKSISKIAVQLPYKKGAAPGGGQSRENLLKNSHRGGKVGMLD
jgi:hypothetical protein